MATQEDEVVNLRNLRISNIVNKPGLGCGDRDISPEAYEDEEIESCRQKSRGRY
tara:strand:+ start:319 stop:480 length:162 start_codon:yes stop_codon:yes gene_type:complete